MIAVISLLNRAKGKDVVVTDVRFKNEIEYIQKNGGIVIRVKRGDDPEWYDDIASEKDDFFRNTYMAAFDVHRSEWDWVGCDVDHTITNDGTIDDLRQNINRVLHFIR